VRQIKKADREAAYLEAVNLAGFEVGEAERFFGTPALPPFELAELERLIRPWPTSEAQARFLAIVEDLMAQATGS
jgi:hypothetical protein